MTSVEIANLQKNNINLKIPKVNGYLVKKSSFSSNLEWYYNRATKILHKCKISGLNYKYFIQVPENACYVFTDCPLNYNDSEFEMELKKEAIIVTIYQSPQDFMFSSLAKFYREIYMEEEASYNWDEFGHFTTDSKKYNRIPIVNAISKLKLDFTVKRDPPEKRRGLEDVLFG